MKPLKEYVTESHLEINQVLKFEGGIKGNHSDDASDKNGIYVAFACKEYDDAYDCIRILYIGKAEGEDSIKKRISDHYNNRDESDSGKQSYWEENYCDKDEVVVYSYAECDNHLYDIEAALIKRNQPAANIKGKEHYIGNAWYVYVKCTGQKGCLSDTTRIMRLVKGSK